MGGGEGRGGEYSTYIISFFLHVGMILATIQAPTSVWPCSRSSHLEFIGVGGRGGNLIYQHHKPCFTHWHGAGSYFFLALCSQQPFRVCWGGGGGGRGGWTLLDMFSYFLKGVVGCCGEGKLHKSYVRWGSRRWCESRWILVSVFIACCRRELQPRRWLVKLAVEALPLKKSWFTKDDSECEGLLISPFAPLIIHCHLFMNPQLQRWKNGKKVANGQ